MLKFKSMWLFLYIMYMKPITDWTDDTQRHRFYNSKAWKDLRTLQLSNEPLCRTCMRNGTYKQAVDVDHIIDIVVDPLLRLEISNLQSLCRNCHSQKTYKSVQSKIEESREKRKIKPVTKWKT